MAKKRKAKKFKLNKLLKDKRFTKALPLTTLAGGVLVGLFIAWVQPPSQHPRTLVWAADERVNIPSDLYTFLAKQRDCKAYRGNNSPNGVALWSVYQIEQGRLAKIAYGCSTDLSYYVVAVKVDSRWTLIKPTEYLENNLPKCAMLTEHNLPKSFESFCREADGSVRENHNK